MGKLDYSIIGKRFGRLVVLDFDHIDQHGASNWLCKCDCGNTSIVCQQSLKKGRTMSRGCLGHERRRMRRAEDLTGKRFGRLYVLRYDHTDRYGSSYWLCECDCGNTHTVRRDSLLNGRVVSCGCKNRENHITHGMHNSRLYKIWDGMKKRCMNPHHMAYSNYGGRGIFICDEWNVFENFRDWALDNGYEDHLTIDRIDNDDGYYPGNCRWVDWFTQGNNRRSCRYITYKDITHSIAEWARLFNVSHSTLTYRINRDDMRDFENYFDR